MNLLNLKKNEIGKIIKIVGDLEFRSRLYSLGIVKGIEIEYLNEAPLSDPIMVKVNDSLIALRKSEAQNIYIERLI